MSCTTENITIHDALPRLIPDQTIVVSGVRVNYSAHIRDPEKETLVFIHGFGASLQVWEDIYELLLRDHNVLRLDLKGSGFSDKPADSKYSPADQAELLLDVLLRLKLTNVVLVGHSLGGGIALLTYQRCRTLASGCVINGLILIDSAGYPQKLPFFVLNILNPFKRSLSYLMSAEYRSRYVLKRIYYLQAAITPERVHRYSYFLDVQGNRNALIETAKALQKLSIGQVLLDLDSISVPTLIIWGENDPVIPLASAHRFHSEIPHSRLVILPLTGHVPQEERPEEVKRVIDEFMRTMR